MLGSKVKIYSLLFLALFWASSCALRGFYEPMTLNLDVPDGPPAYREGFRGGCRSGIGAARSAPFANAYVYGPDYGTGVYQHDPDFILGWANGWFACVIHANTFVSFGPMRHGPLSK